MTNTDVIIDFDNVPTSEKFEAEPEFLYLLGQVTYNWSRLESQITFGLTMRLKMAHPSLRQYGIPLHFKKKLSTWKQIHKTLPFSKHEKNTAVDLAGAARELANLRGLLIHGAWESIVNTDPFTVCLREIKLKNGKRDILEYHVTSDYLESFNLALEHLAQSWSAFTLNLHGSPVDIYRKSVLPIGWRAIFPNLANQ